MTSVEAVLRAATEHTAAGFTDADLSPLRLAVDGAGELGGAGLGRADIGGGAGGAGGPRLRHGLAALGAAAALIAVLAGSLVLAGYLRHHVGHRQSGATTASVVTSGPLTGIPRYFVELHRGRTGEDLAREAMVVDSVTGQVLASIPVPAPYVSFSAVAAAADDRTFVLGAERWPLRPPHAITPLRTKLFELRLDVPRGSRLRTQMIPLGLNIPVDWEGQGLALSPDGTMLAVAASPLTVAVITKVWAYSMTAGTVRSWQDHGEIGRSPWDARSLSWFPDDRTLAYFWQDNGNFELLNTTSASGSLLGHSRRLIGFSSTRFFPTWDADLSPDGSKVVASMQVQAGGRIDEFSAASGHLIRAIVPARLGKTRLIDVLWMNSSGTSMIIELNADLDHPHPPILLLRGQKLTPVTGVHRFVNVSDVAW